MFTDELMQNLPPFTWQAAQDTALLEQYRRFYHLDEVLAISDVQHCFGARSFAGFRILVQAFIRPQNVANVFLLHGYTDHLGLYAQLIRHLLDAGFNVIGLDLPGHGLSPSGERAGIYGFEQYQQVISPMIQEAQSVLAGDWFLLGQSTGGAIAMDYVLNTPQQQFKKIVLFAPLVIPVRWPWVKIQLFALRKFLKRVPRTFSRNSNDANFLRFIREYDPLQTRFLHTSWVQSLYDWQVHFHQSPPSAIACLLVQGGRDAVVDGDYNREQILQKFSKVKILYLPRAKHHLANEIKPLRDKVFARTIEFLLEKSPAEN